MDSIRHNLLIIDDNRTVHQDIERVLLGDQHDGSLERLEAELFDSIQPPPARPNVKLHFATSGEDGLAIVDEMLNQDQHFSVIFVDMRMPPGWDGLVTIERIWERDPDVQAVICTSYSDYSWAEITQRLTRHDQLLILKKPIDPVEIQQATTALTEKWAFLCEVRRELAALKRRSFDLSPQEASNTAQQILAAANLAAEQLAVVGAKTDLLQSELHKRLEVALASLGQIRRLACSLSKGAEVAEDAKESGKQFRSVRCR